jgi:hypothetical protein
MIRPAILGSPNVSIPIHRAVSVQTQAAYNYIKTTMSIT